MYLQNWCWSVGMTARHKREIRAGNRSEGSDTPCHRASQIGCHRAAIGESGGVNALGVHAESCLQIRDQITDKGYIIHRRVFARPGSPSRLMIRSNHPLGIDNEKV